MKLTLCGTIDTDALVASTFAGDPRASLTTVSSVAGQSAIARFILDSGSLDASSLQARLVGIQLIANFARAQGDVRLAAAMAGALLGCLRSAGWFDDNVPGHQQMAVANVMDLCASCMTEAGRCQELADSGDAWSTWLLSRHFMDQWCRVEWSRVEACLHLGEYEAAASLLSVVAATVPSSSEHPIQQRLSDKVDDLLRAADRPDTPSAPFAWIVERTRDVLSRDGIEASLFEPILSDDSTGGEPIRAALGLGPAPVNEDDLSRHVAELPCAASPLHEVSAALERLSDLLQNGVLHPERAAVLAAVAADAASHYGFWEKAMTLRWLVSVAERRAGRFTDAAVTLAMLRRDLADRQRGIGDPLLRAALSTMLPHLYGVSAQVLFDLRASRIPELLDVIEDGKSRILLALASRESEAPMDRTAELRALLARSQHRACYVTLFADDDCTYAVAVLPDGALTSARLAMSRGHLAAAARELGYVNDGEPGSIVREAGLDPDDPGSADYRKPLSVLEPFAQWLDDVLESHSLQEGDVLCVSADGPLFNLPLSALMIRERPLIEYFAVSLVPCAEILIRAAADRQTFRLRGGAAVSVPRSTEFCTGRYDRTVYDNDAATVRRWWGDAETIDAESATVEWLLSRELSHSLVHVGAHGYFDAADPLRRSGVVLAFDGQLPPGRGYDGRSGLLTPVDAARLRVRGAHVTLRACVSGRTTEVTSREALGMMWALFRAGSSSVVAASWNVDIVSAQALLSRFYEQLALDQPVAHALRTAALDLRASGASWSHPFHFAAFSLFGYWE